MRIHVGCQLLIVSDKLSEQANATGVDSTPYTITLIRTVAEFALDPKLPVNTSPPFSDHCQFGVGMATLRVQRAPSQIRIGEFFASLPTGPCPVRQGFEGKPTLFLFAESIAPWRLNLLQCGIFARDLIFWNLSFCVFGDSFRHELGLIEQELAIQQHQGLWGDRGVHAPIAVGFHNRGVESLEKSHWLGTANLQVDASTCVLRGDNLTGVVLLQRN